MLHFHVSFAESTSAATHRRHFFQAFDIAVFTIRYVQTHK